MVTGVDPDRRYTDCAKTFKVNIQITKILRSFATDKFAADLVVRSAFALDYDHMPSGARQVRGDSATSDAATNH